MGKYTSGMDFGKSQDKVLNATRMSSVRLVVLYL